MSPDSQCWRLLLVQDDERLAETLQNVLRSDSRFEVVALARHGADGVTLALRLRPDVILMDIEMPVMDGVEATKEIIAGWPSTRIIAVSGSDYSERALEARSAGAYDYVRKDRLGQDLTDALLAAVRRH